MHRHRSVVPVVHSLCQSRLASTAVKTKPVAWDTSSDSVNTSKWAIPNTGKLPSSSKWKLPPAAGTAPSAPSARPNLDKWTLPPARSSAGPNEPLFRPPAPNQKNPHANRNDTSRSRPFRRDQPPSLRADPRRDLAPHQLADGSTIRPSNMKENSQEGPSRSKWSRYGTPADEVLARKRQVGPSRPAMQIPIPKNAAGPSSERAKTARSTQNDDAEPVVMLEEVVDSVEGSEQTKHHRPGRVGYKARGSIRMHMNEDVVIPSHPRVHPHNTTAKKQKKKTVVEKRVSLDVYIPSTVSVRQLARLLDIPLEDLQQKMWESGMGDQLSYDHILSSDYAVLIAEELGRNPIVNDEAAFDIHPAPTHQSPNALPLRPPVVTIMGHVDHGKTTLLDTLRSSAVAKGEAGGITQHIGAFSVPVPGVSPSTEGPKSITFLDTPGHAAFSAMRARGAGVTDLVVLVVAADDGVMPQTKEVIDLVKRDEGRVGLVVAINKVDKPGVDVEHVQKALLAEDVQLEVFGGDIPSVEVSGLTGHGLPDLVETLSALAEMQNLRAEVDIPVHGYVLESKMHKGLGAVATVLILRGTLKPSAHLICGLTQAKVRVMNDPSGSAVKTAGPGTAVTVSGWKSLPNAGDEVLSASESDIKRALANRQRRADLDASLLDAEAINQFRRQEREQREKEQAETAAEGLSSNPAGALGDHAKDNGPKELRLVVKGDVSGSVEAVVGALQGIGNDKAVTKIVSSGVGDISESDVTMAKASGAMVVGFSVKAPRSVEAIAARNDVSIYSSAIIYQLMDEVKKRVIELLPRVVEKRVTGEATVLQLFDIQLKGKATRKIAGCRVTNGLVEKAKRARLVRDGQVLHEGNLDTMRLLKKDVIEIRKGSECGLGLAGFDDIREGDLIQMYHEVESLGSL